MATYKLLKQQKALKWFEENIYILGFKVILIATAIVFVVEPFFYEKVVKVGGYSFMNSPSCIIPVFLAAISGSCYVFGRIHSKIKKGIFSLLDLTIIAIGGYGIFLGFFKLEQYPTQNGVPSYLVVGLLAWIIGSILNLEIGNGIREQYSNYCKRLVGKAKSDKSSFFNQIQYFIFCVVRKIRKDFSNIFKNDVIKVKLASNSTTLERDEKTARKGSPIIIDLNIQEIATIDRPVEVIDKEGLNFLPLAKTILDSISAYPSNKSITIGINGDWGSGKSSIIDLVKYLAQKEGNRAKFIDFKPWIYPDENSLLQSYLKIWKGEVNDVKIQLAFEDYAQYLTGIQHSSSKWDIFSLFKKKDTLLNTGAVISNYLLNSNIKHVVIIDDLDRVEAKEVLEVAKLTRTIAAFPNVVYILAYDRNYIDSLLEEKLDRVKGNSFFDKVITAEYRVPKLDSKVVLAQLLLLIKVNEPFIKGHNARFDINAFSQRLEEISFRISYIDYLPTLRDAKRFLNGLLLRFDSLCQVHRVDFIDIFILELVFYKYKKSYDKFYENIEGSLSHIRGNGNNMEHLEIGSTTLFSIFKEGKKPNQVDNIIDIYFSYLNNSRFSSADVDLVFNNPKDVSVIKGYIDEGFVEPIILGTLNKYASYGAAYSYRSLEDSGAFNILEDIRKNIHEDYVFQDDSVFRITEALIETHGILEKNGGPNSLTNRGFIDKLRKIVYEFALPFPIYDVDLDNSILHFSTNSFSYSNTRPNEDDSTYNKVFDIYNKKYNFTFEIPSIQHWRFGFKLSKTTNFPVAISIRLYEEYPLFHIGKDITREKVENKGDVLATFYKNDVVVGQETTEDYIYDVKLNPSKTIGLRIGKVATTVVINLYADGKHVTDISIPDMSEYNFIKLFAWADNDKVNNGDKYDISVDVSDRGPRLFTSSTTENL